MLPFNYNRGNEVTIIILYSIYIFIVLVPLPPVINRIDISAVDFMFLTIIFSLFYLWIKLEWALVPNVDERAKDNFISILPIMVLMGVGIITLTTNMVVGYPYFRIESTIIFVAVMIFDLLLIRKIGSVMLELKDKIHMR